MYNSYIIECPAMCDLYWEFINLKYPDEPEELHASSRKPLVKLNDNLAALNAYLKELVEDNDLRFYSYDELTEYVLVNHPTELDCDVVAMCLKAMESVFHLLCPKSDNDVVVLDRHGNVAVVMEC